MQKAPCSVFLGWDSPSDDDFAQEARIVLAARNFSKEITTSVLWLNDRDLDITCVRLNPLRFEDHLLLNVEQIIPLPEAVDYQVYGTKSERNVLLVPAIKIIHC